VAFHSTVLDGLGVAGRDVDAMRAGREPSDSAAAAVYALATALVSAHGEVAPELLDRVRAAGLSDEGILEIVAECTFAGLVGTIDNLAERVELDAFLAPRAWTAS
jgi:alkylhydroperoxidase family enzyme